MYIPGYQSVNTLFGHFPEGMAGAVRTFSVCPDEKINKTIQYSYFQFITLRYAFFPSEKFGYEYN